MTDATRMQHAILDALEKQPGLDAACIGVTVCHGVVTLRGTVRSDTEKHAARRIVERLETVRAVVDELVVEAEHAPGETDGDLARAALAAIAVEPLLRAEHIKVCVENAWVTLVGEVTSEDQRQAARHALRRVRGVRGISNHVVVAARAEAASGRHA